MHAYMHTYLHADLNTLHAHMHASQHVMRNTNSPITTDDNCKGAGRIPNYHPLGITTVHIGGQHRNASVGEMVLQPHTHRDARVGALV